ncbi:hypothetical protein CEXT_519401 [Caerostris extrusa]|uniref:Uncharacterized protein n=1 Tax=Caerostris extrusa TaxID=172846 RepID=A0AAV4W088_CAEEX|nr:hypothetical protein CEXT_519401 [Caerostris extrusa]
MASLKGMGKTSSPPLRRRSPRRPNDHCVVNHQIPSQRAASLKGMCKPPAHLLEDDLHFDQTIIVLDVQTSSAPCSQTISRRPSDHCVVDTRKVERGFSAAASLRIMCSGSLALSLRNLLTLSSKYRYRRYWLLIDICQFWIVFGCVCV